MSEASTSNGERRHFSRISMDGKAWLHCRGAVWLASLADLSLKGALITRPENWDSAADEEPCRLELVLGDGDLMLTMEGGIAHVGDEYIGFRCDHLPLESVSHLKRMLELNLGDENLLERELRELIR